ncbi:MAG: methyl-accepting chemotaxis protein [Syntrophothermus sp.]
MNDFSMKFGLKRKFAVVFILYSLLVLLLSYTAWHDLTGQHETVVDISANKMPAINFLLQLDRDMHQALIAVKNLTNINDVSKSDKYYEDYTSNMKQVTERWGKYKALDSNEKNKALHGNFEQGFAKWQSTADSYIAEFRGKAVTDTANKIAKESELLSAFDNSREFINKLTENLEAQVAEEEKANEEDYSGAASLLIFIIIASLIYTFFSWFFMSRNIVNPVIHLKEKAIEVSGGSTTATANVKNKDEIGLLADAFNKMVGNIGGLLREADDKTRAAREAADKAAEAEKASKEHEVYLRDSVNSLLGEMQKFADGDLTVKIKVEKNDIIGNLFTGFNQTVETFNKLVTNVTHAVNATASSVNEISASSEQMAAGSQEQTQQTSEIASSVEEMTKTIMETTQNVNNAAGMARTASIAAEKGSSKVEETKKGIHKIVTSSAETAKIITSLSHKSDQIGEITQVIDDIADQTNLLALNAAIEAARAGEQGRGFAVVADEVRKLAERTTKATKEIADTIKAIQLEAKEADNSMNVAKSAVEEGMKLTEDVAVVLSQIMGEVEKVNDVVAQVAAASEEQSATAEQISKNIEGISSVSQESASGIQQIARASEDLSNLATNLQGMINKFRLDNGGSYSGYGKQLAGHKKQLN